ncbi:MAG: ATP-binding cassette domain-containing protein [Candidatus Binatia bacterium]
MKQEPAIQVDNLTVRFDGTTVIDGFSMRLASGEKATLTGRSGSGKSTILRCILGFTVPDKGSIRIQGQQVTGASIWKLRTRLAYVAQEPDLGAGRVREILERPFTYRANAHLRYNLSQAAELFRVFLLPTDLMDKDIATLSGGEKQRVAVISAVLLARNIFVLDEASSALDKASTQAIGDYFRSLDSLTVLSVAHDPEGFSFFDKIIELPGGSDRNKS